MNVHDSQKVSALLAHAGYRIADDPEDADLLIVNTCSIREKAEHRLYTDLGRLREWKQQRAGRVLGVAGCVAQQEGDAILRRFAAVDFVYGTHNLRWVPVLAAAAEQGERGLRIEENRSLERFDLPQHHPDLPSESPGRAFITVMEGCDMFCAFCVVPNTRGREISRPADAIAAEVRSLAAGALEITLLGHTVNGTGVTTCAAGADPGRHGELRDAVATARGREGSRAHPIHEPDPSFFDDDLVRATAIWSRSAPTCTCPRRAGPTRCSPGCAGPTPPPRTARCASACAPGAPRCGAHHRPDRRLSRRK